MIDNRTPYPQGRSDQRRKDWPVLAALLALWFYVVFVERKK